MRRDCGTRLRWLGCVQSLSQNTPPTKYNFADVLPATMVCATDETLEDALYDIQCTRELLHSLRCASKDEAPITAR